MNLQLFASPVSEVDSSTKLDSLTIAGGPRELRLLAGFLAQAADEIEAHGPHVRHQEFANEESVKAYEGLLPAIYVSQCV